MDSELIKSFLVGLGFGVDEASLSKFNKAISSATLKVAALYGTIQVAAAGIAFGLGKISQSFEDIGYEYRLIAPAFNKFLFIRNELFRAYGAAGVSLTKTVQSAVKLNMSLTRTKIALEALYKSVGARFFDLFTKQSDIFREKLYKNMPKIQAVLERFIFFVFKAFDATVILGERVWSILTRVYDFFAKLHEATSGWSTIVLGLVAAWQFLNLSFLATPFGMLITGFTALVALWDDFNTFVEGGQSFINWGSDATKTIVGLASVIAGAAVAFGLWTAASAAWTAISGLVIATVGVLTGELSVMAIALAIIEAPIWLIVGAIVALIGALTFLDHKWQIFGGTLSGFFNGIGGKVLDFFAGSHVQNGVQNASGFFTQPNAQANLGNNNATNGGGGGMSGADYLNKIAPLGSNSNTNYSTSQNLQQSTNININSTADAQSLAKYTAGEQGKVNADMARNFKVPLK